MLRKAVLICARIASPLLVIFAVVLFCGPALALAQSPVRNRITQEVIPGSTIALPGTVSPLARPAFDIGHANPSTRLTGMTIYFKPSAEQQAALDNLVKQQQTPGSPLYHQWITPAQYASQFGLSASDLAQVQAWLEQQGFSVDRVANSRNAISFSGTVAQVESAFQTQIHHYSINGVTHTANAAPLSIPSAFAGVVLAVRNVSDFRPHPLHRLRRSTAITPQYNWSSNGTQYHFLAPGDFATIYDLSPLYGAGYTGSGETIVITGQSAVEASDITNFQNAAGLTQKAPTMTLVPGTGTSAFEDKYGDEDESDIDLEWSGAVARGATINFAYVGNNQNYSVFDALQYAIDNDLGSIVSISYGACESDFPSADVSTFQSWFQQANAQGQTIVAAAGDNGATDCEITTGSKPSVVNGDQATLGLAVDLPAASPYVTGIGGTEFLADVNAPGTYWNSSNSTADSSAIQYISEEVWNDTSTSNGIEAGGGGKSILFPKPSWQTGTGVPSDGHRDVPDLSLNASPNHDGYLYCASGSDADPSSCSNGFLDGSGDPDVAGGTSFGAPTFSGILAILTQRLGSKGLGNVNPEIYSLAASAYSSVFHDTTVGNNKVPCKIGSTGCTTSPIGYSATTGYDLASGWGSIDAANFVNAFNGGSSASSIATTTTLTASNSAPVVNTAITLTATVASDSGSTTPAGTVQFVIDGANAGGAVALSSSGVATYSYTPTTAGSHTIVANYTPSNSAVSAASSSTLAITVSASTSGSKSFSLSATNVTVAQGSSGTSTVTVTPSGGFTGSVALSVSAPSSLINACFTYANPTATTAGTITIYTSDGACATTGSKRVATVAMKSGDGRSGLTLTRAFSGVTLASLMLIGLPGFRRRRWPVLCAVLFLASFSLAVSGCGSVSGNTVSKSAPSSPTTPTGSYTLTLTGTNSTLNLSASTTFTLVVNAAN
ncbi:MAG: protease pro-enzyme activation domain-containing protein [Silvibacterium sp.]